jgi:hypothetical protein
MDVPMFALQVCQAIRLLGAAQPWLGGFRQSGEVRGMLLARHRQLTARLQLLQCVLAHGL